MPTDKQQQSIKFARLQPAYAEQGITLIELLIALSLFAFIISALYNFYLVGLSGWQRSVDHLEYQQSARISMNKMINELRYAHEVFLLNENDEEIYFRVNYKGKSTLFRFRLAGRQLVFEQLKDNYSHYAYNVVSLGITDLKFAIDDTYLVSISIDAGNDSKIITLTGSIRPRNIPLPEVDYESP